jgi:hypothetical protein
MKKALVVALSDEELLDLGCGIIDRDKAGALAFFDRHLKKKVNQAPEVAAGIILPGDCQITFGKG